MGRRTDRMEHRHDSPTQKDTARIKPMSGAEESDNTYVKWPYMIDSPDTLAHRMCHAADDRETENERGESGAPR